MRKVMSLFLAVCIGFLFVVPGVMAAKNKPGTKACYSINNGTLVDYRLALSFKHLGMKIRDANGIQKIYLIAGAMYNGTTWHNVEGSGYWDKTSDLFEGHIGGLVVDNISCAIYLNRYITYYNMYCRISDGPAVEYPLTKINCRDQILD